MQPVVDEYGMPIGPQVSTKEDMPQTKWLPEQADRARQMMKEESGEDIMNYIPALFRQMKEDEWGEKRTDGELLAEWLNMDEQQQDIVSKGRERYAEAMKYYTSTYPQEEQRQRLNAEYKAGTLGGSSAAGRTQAYKAMTTHNEAAAPWIEADKKKWSTQDAKAFREETISETMHDPYATVPESYREYATKAWGKKGSEDAYFTAWMNLSNKERKDWLHRDQVKALFDGEGVQRMQDIRTRAEAKSVGFMDKVKAHYNAFGRSSNNVGMLPLSMAILQEGHDINKQTSRAIDKAEEMKQAYKNHQGDENFFVGAFKGLKDGITDVDTWTGVYMLGEMNLLHSIVDKMNKGEKLTQDEEDYFEAQAYKMAVEAALADDLGWGYGSGKTTAVSIPMMLQMIATGGGGLATKGVDKVAAKIGERAVKGYGKTILKRMLMKGVGKGATRALTLASRVPLAFADGAVQTTIWQSDKVVADAVRRSTGTKELAKKAGEMFGIEIEGKEAEDFGKALSKSFALYAAENGTEFLGNAFLDPLGDWMGKGIKKVVKGTKVYDDFAQVITSARRTGAGAALYDVATMGDSPFIKELMGKSQWSGLLGEGVEEKINEGINILMGEAEAEDFFDLEKNAQMLLGLSWTSLAFGVANGYSRTRAYAKIKKELDRAEKIGTLAFTAKEGEQLQETWEDFKGRIDQMSYPQLKHALSELSAEWRAAESGTISRDRAEAQLRYIMGRGQLLGFAAADSQAEMQNPFTEEQQEIDEATGEGINADEQTQKTITEERNIAEQALYDQIGEDVDEFVARYGETSDQQLQGIRADESLSDEVRDIAENYVVTNAKFNGVVEAAEAEIEQAEQAAQREVETNANMDKEQVVRVTVDRVGEDGMTMEPTGAYVVQGDALGEDGVYDGSTVLQIRYADGTTEQVSASNVKVESVHPLQEMIDAAREGARMETINAVSTRMQNSVPTGADEVMQPGQRVILEDGRAGVVESFDGVQMYQVKMDDGSNVVAPASVLRDEAAAQSAAQITAQAQENVKHSIAGRRGKRMSRQARMQQQSQSPTLADVRAQQQDMAAEQTSPQTATEQIPISETGARAYEQAEPSLAWQSLVEQSGGDAQIAESALMSTIRQKEDALRQLESEAVAAGNSIEETIAAQTQHKARVEAAKADLAKWQAIAKVNQDAKAEALQESNKKAAAESNAQIDVNKVAEETGADAKEVKRLVDLCSALGVKVQFEGYTTTDGTSQGHLTNASVDTGSRTITISKLQMAKGTGIHFILGHELTHQIKADGNKELWGKYLESVVNAVGIEAFQTKLASMSMTYMQAGAYQNMTMEEFREAMQEEVCADFAGEAVFSPGNVKKFLGVEPTLIEKITGKIQEMFDTIRKKIYGFSMPQDIAYAAEQWQQLAEGKELTEQTGAETRHSLVGTTGARALDKAEGTTVRMDNMDVAEEMEAAGKDAETIWMATGWERGVDGKWRYEVLEDFAYEEPRAKAERLQDEYQQVQNEKENIYRYLNMLPARGLTEQQKAIKKEQNARLKKLIRQGEKLQDEIIESNFDTTLGELIGTDNNIIRAYPELASMPVSFVADSRFMDAGLKGAFDGEGIWINPTLENTAPTLLHEVQHAIQRIEGFARGGNTGSVKTKADAFREDVRPLHEMMLDTPEWAERQRLQNRWFEETDAAEIAKIEQRVNEINESGVLDAIQSKRKQLQEKYGSDATVGKILGSPYAEDAEIWEQLPESFNDKYEAYRNLAGEAEARNVSARLNMSEEERRQTRPGKTEDVAREEQTVINTEVSDKAGAQLEETANATKFSIVQDPQLIAELEASPKRMGYRNVVQREDGLFEAPMGNSLRGNGITVENTPFAMGQWEQSEEHPELVYGDNKITLVKPDGKTVADVNYNPYIHNRLNTLNAQFKQAWERPDLVYVETEVPVTDLEGGYMAEHAHLSTGVHQWSNGALMLSRYDKPVRIVPWDEVAIPWIEKYKKSGVHFDIVPPALRPILAEAGVEIKAPHNGMGENCIKAYEEWKAQQGVKYSDIKPIGQGYFGNIYDQFKGKPKEAIEFLMQIKEGEAIGALTHPEIGEIDLVWGKEGTGKSDGFGLAKLVKFHPEVLENLQGILDGMHIVTRSSNRVNLESDTHKASVRLTWDNQRKNWLLTAFEKKNSVSDNTTDTGETSLRGKQNDTATLQDTVFNSKDTQSVSTEQTDKKEISEKSAESNMEVTNEEVKPTDNVGTFDAENADIRYSMPGHSVASRIYGHPFTGTWQKFLQRAPKGVLKPGYGIIDESRLPEFADWYRMLVPEAEEYKEFVSWFLEGATATEKKHVQSVMDGVDKIVDDYRRLAEGDNSVLSLENNARFSITPDILVANERFNAELDEFKAKTHKGLLHLGKPGAILRTIGVDADEMTLSPSVLSRHLKKHNLTADDLIGLPLSVQTPILAYRHGDKNPNLVVVTEMDVKGGKLSVSLELDENGHVVEIDNIRSVHSKDATKEMARLGAMREGELEKALRWVEKEEVQDWLGIADLNRPIHTINPELSSVANVLLSFQNPPILEDESSQNVENATSGEQKYSLPARPATPKRNEGEGIMAYAERVARVLKEQRTWDRKHKDSVEGMKDIEKMLEEMDADGVIADKKAIAQLYARYEAAKARAKENRRKHGAELREARKKLNALVKKQGNAQDKIADLLERYENWKTLRDKVRSALDNKNLSSINKSTLMAMLKAMGTATEANTEELSEMDAILAEIEIKTAKTEISEMLDEKRRKLNSKGMAVGKGVDLDTQKVLDMTKKNLSDLTTDKMQEEITKLRSENWHLRRDQEGEYADMAEEQKQERIAQNNEKIRKLREDLETELRSRSTKTVEEVEAELRELTGREEEWDERDYLVYQALQFKKQMADFNEAEKAAIEFEHEIDKKAAEASDLYRQMRQSGISNEEKEDLKQKYSEAKRIIAAMQQSLIEQKQIQAEKTKSFAEDLKEYIANGHAKYKEELEMQKERKKELVRKAMHDITGTGKRPQSVNTGKENKSEKPAWYKWIFDGSLSSLDYMLKKVSTRTFGRDSWLYQHFISGPNGVIAANDTKIQGLYAAKNALEEKAQELFGMSYEEKMRKDSKEGDLGIEIVAYPMDRFGEPEMMPLKLSKGQATYIYMVWKMSDGKMKLSAQGFNQDMIDVIEDYIGPRNVEWAEWVQEEYLPTLREKYNSRYEEMYGTSLGAIEHYVPLKIQGQSIRQEIDLEQESPATSLSAKHGSLIQRTRNVNPVDISTNAMEMLVEHITDMEEFYAYAPVRRDLQHILSSTAFHNQLNANTPGDFKRLVDAAKIAVGLYGGREAANDRIQKIWTSLQKGWISANIAFRDMTAIKQALAAPSFLSYSQDPAYVAHLMKNIGMVYGRNIPGLLIPTLPFGEFLLNPVMKKADKRGGIASKLMGETFQWCIDNFPDFKERVMKGSAGDLRLEDKGLSQWLDKLTEIGMSYNAFVDALTCAVGIKSIYDYEMGRARKKYDDLARDLGMTEEWKQRRMKEAEHMARLNATLYYNQTQQSGHNALLAPLQVSSNALLRSLALYKNSSLSNVRMAKEGWDDMLRYCGNKRMRNKMIEEYTRRMMEEYELEEDEARKRAIDYCRSQVRKAAFRFGMHGYVLNLLWNAGSKGMLGFWAGKALMAVLTGIEPDGDDEETPIIKEGTDMLMYWAAMPISGTIVGDLIENRSSTEDMAIGLMPENLADLAKECSKIYEDEGLSTNLLLAGLKHAAVFGGIDVETWANSMDGYYRLVADTGNNDERLLALMLVLNSPRSNRMAVARELYKGASGEEFQKAIELAGRYNRPAWAYGREMTDKVKSDMINWYIEDNMTPEEAERAKEVRKWKARIEAAKTIDEARALYDEAPDMAIKEMVQQRMNKIANPTQEKTFEEKVESKEKDIYAMEDEQYKYYQEVCEGTDVAEDIALREKIKQYAPAWNEYVASPERSKVMERRGSEILKYRMLSKYRSNINKAKAILDRNKDKSQLGRIRKMRKEALAM